MKINLPTIFSFNLWGPIATNTNYISLFKRNGLESLLQNENTHLLPILNFDQSSLENRSILFTNKLENFLESQNIQNFNLVSFCLNGLDARLSLYENENLKNKINKFLTIGTPHYSSVLSNAIKKNLIPSPLLEKINFISGCHSNSFIELDIQFMKDFNNYVEDEKQENFYSLNGDKVYEELNPIFKDIFKILLDLKLSKDLYFGDGLFFDEETKYFNHFGQFNTDFYGLSPYGIDKNISKALQNFI